MTVRTSFLPLLFLWVSFFGAARCDAQQNRYVYLTFDDGPQEGTHNVVSVLGSTVKGSFLHTGKNVFLPVHKQRVREIRDAGHLQCNHSFNHWDADTNYQNPPVGKPNDVWLQDVKHCEAVIADCLGQVPPPQLVYLRLPGKNAWRVDGIVRDDLSTKRVADFLQTQGYKLFGWDLKWSGEDHNDLVEPVDTMVDGIVKRLAGTLPTVRPRKVVLLMHDRQFPDDAHAQKLRQLIDGIKAKSPGVKFSTLDKYATDP